MTNEIKYVVARAKYVGKDKRGNPLYESKVEDTNISEEESYREPYRGTISLCFWTVTNMIRRNSKDKSERDKKDITVRLEI